MKFKLKKIQEIVIITSDKQKMTDLFVKYGGWSSDVGFGKSDVGTALPTSDIPNPTSVHPSVLNAWELPKTASATDMLIQYMAIPFGKIRFVELKGIKQEPMRPATKIWDTGGIADIDIRTHDIYEVHNDLVERGWSGASVPMALPITNFKIDECLVSNADSMMIALAKRYFPPLELVEGKQFASHIYLSAMVVKNLELGTHFFTKQLGFQLVNENLVVKFPPNSANNFGVPHNFSDKFEFTLDLYSPDGTRDTMCECIEIKGLSGNDFSSRCVPPNRGILSYRIEVEGIENYLNFVKNNGVKVLGSLKGFLRLNPPLNIQAWNGIGKVKTFRVVSPDGAWVEFFEKQF
jgi:catechol 2,3-dioxygenase-like lactoylglutathione lyase family enzyme